MNQRRPIQPPLLRSDSTIAIVAPAGIVDRSKLEASIAYVHQLGFKTKTYRDIYAKCDTFAGDDSDRATELMSAFKDSEVQAIFAARGGYGCIRLLQKLDYNVIAAHPKIFLGYSDNTVLHAAFHKKCNLITYHGPHASDFRHSNGGMTASCEASLWQTLSGDGFEAWQGRLSSPIREASRTSLDRQAGLRTIVTGAATGPIVGGNLALVCALLGTEYQVDTADKILFLEDVDEPPYRVDRFLQQLRLAGSFERVAGVVLGSFTRCGDTASNWPTHTVLEKFFEDARFPTVSGFPAGHGPINCTFPLGVEATINATAEQPEVTVAANQTLGGALKVPLEIRWQRQAELALTGRHVIVYAVGNLEAAFPRRRWFFDLSQFRKWTNGKWQISGLGQPRPHSINFLDAISRNRLRIGDMAEPVKKVSSFRVVAEDAMDAKTTKSHSATTEAPRFDDVPKIRTSPEIVTRELTLYFANRLVLDRINLTISPNCVTSIIGPTGTGKSTFLRCINRTNDMLEGVRTTGEILLDGHDINAPGTDVAKLRKRVALQTYAILPTSVFENVAYGPRVAGVVSATGLRAAVQVGLQRAGLWDEVEKMLDERASRLSLGQQYRLCIARALATEPDVLLLDEPALALDPRATARLEDLIFELKKRLTIVTVMNSVQQAATISDFTAFLLQGRLIEAGPTTDVFTNPKDRRTEDYVRGRFE